MAHCIIISTVARYFLYNAFRIMIPWLIREWSVELVEGAVSQLAYNLIAKAELLTLNGTNRQPLPESEQILTRDALCGRSKGCGFANELANGHYRLIVVCTRQADKLFKNLQLIRYHDSHGWKHS